MTRKEKSLLNVYVSMHALVCAFTLCTFFFFRFNTIKTWVVSLYYRGVVGYNFLWQNIAYISLKISQCRH